MSNMYERMRTDSEWISANKAQDVDVNTRTHGQHYIYNYAPNAGERIEMSMRSMGKQFDWEMEKYRNSKKPVDRGNKRRLLKNFVRFCKNPFGMTFWKLKGLNGGGRAAVTYFYCMFPALFVLYYFESMHENRKNQFFVSIGDPMNGNYGSMIGNHDSKRPEPSTFSEGLSFIKTDSYNYVVNPTYKQNYKKHTQTLDRNMGDILSYYGSSDLESAHAKNFGFN